MSMTGKLVQSSEKTSRKPRADSERNREKLLVAARDVFSAGGPEASLEAVARKAGVGIGTLYRHFPTREALFQAVYSREIDQLVELAARLAAEEPPFEALRHWLHAQIRMVATKKGMLAALNPVFDGATEVFAAHQELNRRAVGDLMARAVAAGAIRDDIEPADVMRAVIGMCYTRDQPGWQDTVIRLVDVFLDGLRRRSDAAE
jgi:AcrR family transcriptional regulator